MTKDPTPPPTAPQPDRDPKPPKPAIAPGSGGKDEGPAFGTPGTPADQEAEKHENDFA